MRFPNLFLAQLQQNQAQNPNVENVVNPTNAEHVADGVVQVEETIPVIKLVLDSWPIMLPLLIMSVIAIYIWVERYMAIQKASKIGPNFMSDIKSAVSKGNFDDALKICDRSDSPTARMIHKGVSRLGKPLEDISTSIENVGRLEISSLEKNLSILATVSGAAPMIGFLGTVIGMMTTFHEMARGGNGGIQIEDLSNGIMYAMATTVAGLIVGIIAYLAYNLLVSKIDKVVRDTEDKALEFMDLLHQPAED